MTDETDPALEWLREIVEPTVADFQNARDNKRLGCLAAIAVATMTEHYFRARPQLGTSDAHKSKFKSEIRDPKNGSGNACIGILADIANATKHVRPKNGYGHEEMRPYRLNSFGIMRAGWPLGGTEILIGEKRQWRLSQILDIAMTFWREKLAEDGRAAAGHAVARQAWPETGEKKQKVLAICSAALAASSVFIFAISTC